MIYSTKEAKMKVDQFKNLIKESIKEVLVEEGLLKEVISAVMKESQQMDSKSVAEAMMQVQTMQANLNNSKAHKVDEAFEDETKANRERAERNIEKMQDLRNRMMESIGKSSYKDLYNLEGLDLFEGTTPLSKGGSPGAGPSEQGPLSGVDPDDAGVAIDSLLGNKKLWQQLVKK